MSTEAAVVTLLVVDDDIHHVELIKKGLAREGLEIVAATDPQKGLELFTRKQPQIALLDLVMPGMGGMELLERIIEIDPGTEVILLTGHYSTESAVEAIQKGACDYLNKPVSLEKLRQRVDRLLAEAQRRQRTWQLDRELLEQFQLEGMVGRSPLMLDVFARIRRVAPHYRTVLLSGPTGTGKELAARALHRLSPVAAGPFVACNCTALVETLLESELFGHVAGAFTGATKDKKGLFEHAHGGTLLLDEIGDMPLPAQAKLLRVVQTQEVQRVGSPETRKVDVRIVAATNRDLRELVSEGKFREDLFYRLSMVEIKMPALVSRREDLPLLLRHFVERFAAQYGKPIRGITQRAQALLGRYPFPGNVRELENLIGHACMMAEGPVLDIRDFPEQVRGPQASGDWSAVQDTELLPLEEVQRRHILRVLERVEGNRVRAAEILGIGRTTLYRFLQEEEETASEPKAVP